MRLVLDTNVVVSALLTPVRPHAEAVRWLFDAHDILYSAAMLAQLVDVLSRPKLQRYIPLDRTGEFLRFYQQFTQQVVVTQRVVLCRDPSDDELLSVALSGGAQALLTSDLDLRVLHPFRGIDIKTVSEFMVDQAPDRSA